METFRPGAISIKYVNENDDYERVLRENLRLEFRRALHAVAQAGIIPSAHYPVFRNKRKENSRIPSWEEVSPDRAELYRISRLRSPQALIAFPSISLESRLRMFRTLHPPIMEKPRGLDIVGLERRKRIFSFNVENPLLGTPREDLLASGKSYYTTADVDILFVDGSETPPEESKRGSVEEIWTKHELIGYQHMDIDAALAFHLRWICEHQPSPFCDLGLLDAYIPKDKSGALLWATFEPSSQDLEFHTWETGQRSIGIRRAVPVKAKQPEKAPGPVHIIHAP